MKRKLKINFGYFWADFNKEDNYFTRSLRKNYDVEISDEPELYFFTHAYNGRHDYLKYKCHRVFLGWENERANWDIADYVIDCDIYQDNPRHLHWPIWAAWNLQPLLEKKDERIYLSKKKFACMVVSNANAQERIRFFEVLSKYKQVDSGGKWMNNVGGPVADKRAFISDYKFVISFENSSHPGYSTEKIIEPMLSSCVPIYWGDPLISKCFNSKSFIDISEYDSYEAAINRIIALDKDDNQYLSMVREPWFEGNKIPEAYNPEKLDTFLQFIISDIREKKPVAAMKFKQFKHMLNLKMGKFNSMLRQRFRIKTKTFR